MTNKYLFIGGFPSSGTSALYRCLQHLQFSCGPLQEGQYDLTSPEVLKHTSGTLWEPISKFSQLEKLEITRWINNYTKDSNYNWFMEKSPQHIQKFLALQEMLPYTSYFIIVKRNPIQTILSWRKRWNVSDELVQSILTFMIKFEKEYKYLLPRRVEVFYEDLALDFKNSFTKILQFLKLAYPVGKIETLIKEPGLTPKIMSIHLDISSFSKETLKLIQELSTLWRYTRDYDFYHYGIKNCPDCGRPLNIPVCNTCAYMGNKYDKH